MKAYNKIILFSLAAAIVGCRPAEEIIEDTGVASFVAAFETVKGATATWNEENKVIVVDSQDASHKFALTYGAGKEDGEFSGLINPNSLVKYVVYAPDENTVDYDSGSGVFGMNLPATYNAKAAGTLITANNAAIGILQGSQVELKSICGFIKFSLESNGSTFEDQGQEFPLTDIKRVIISSIDGKCFTGEIKAKWNQAAYVPEFISVENGSDTIVFNTRALSSSQGDIYYEAGDYCLPVIAQNYERVSITLEDADGHQTTLTERSIDVKRATASNLGSLDWPTEVVSANFLFSSPTESKEQEVYSFASENLMCDRVSQTTGQTVAGKSKKNTVVDFEHQGVGYQLFATNGYGRSTNTSGCLLALMFNSYTASWTYASDTWTVGSPNGYAWVRIPEHEGVLSKIEISIISKEGTQFSISSEVDPETGVGKSDIVPLRATKVAQSTYDIQTLSPANTKPGMAYYICMGNGHSYRIQSWKFHYKVFDN